MSVEDVNKESLRRQIEEVWNKGNLEILPEIISPDFLFIDPSGVELKGPEGFKQLVSVWRNVFPDLHFAIDDLIAEGEKLAARFTYTGTFKGKYGDIEPTGNQIKMTEALFFLFKEGKVVEQLNFIDWFSFYQQSGIPIPTD